jgi:hypothetical protein
MNKVTIFFRILLFYYTCTDFVDKKERVFNFYKFLAVSINFYFLSSIGCGDIEKVVAGRVGG